MSKTWKRETCKSKMSVEDKLYRLGDHLMMLDEKDSLQLGVLGADYEHQEVNLVKRFIKKGDVVLDIGANIGYYSLLLANLVGEKGQVYAFEPEPANFSILQKNVRLNNYHNIYLEPKAASGVNRVKDLYICEDNKGMHRLYPSLCCSGKIAVEAVALDDYLKEKINRLDFVKMDIEGAEFMALSGMKHLMGKYKPMLLTEFSPAALYECGVLPRQYLDLLWSLGYTIYDVSLQLVEKDELLRDMVLFQKAMGEIFPRLKKRALHEIIQQLTEELAEYSYGRPLVENFLCIRDKD